MLVDPEDIVTASEIAERAGVRPSAVANWADRHPDFPKPIKDVPRCRLWLWSEVRTWLWITGRQKY